MQIGKNITRVKVRTRLIKVTYCYLEKMATKIMEKVIEYLYLDEKGEIMYTSRNTPLEYEEQTDCIKIECNSEYDMNRLLDKLITN